MFVWYSGRQLSNEITSVVLKFYNDDRYSSVMPGKKDSVSTHDNNGVNLHSKKIDFDELKRVAPTFSRGASQRYHWIFQFCHVTPKALCFGRIEWHTHCVCVCSVHQNIKLMILGKILQSCIK